MKVVTDGVIGLMISDLQLLASPRLLHASRRTGEHVVQFAPPPTNQHIAAMMHQRHRGTEQIPYLKGDSSEPIVQLEIICMCQVAKKTPQWP